MAKRAKQQNIPGTEPEVHADIEEAADRYREIRDNRMELTKEEGKAKAALLAAMNAHSVDAYQLEDGAVVTVSEKKDVKVRQPKDDEDAGYDDVEDAA